MHFARKENYSNMIRMGLLVALEGGGAHHGLSCAYFSAW